MSYQIRTQHGGGELPVEAVAGAELELLIGLYAAMTPGESRDPSWVPARLPTRVEAAIEPLGRSAGELWLHLLGLPLEGLRIEDAPAEELRRHLVGVHVPAWRQLVGGETLEAAAAGDPDAARRLLAHPRYYGCRAEESLAALLPLDAAETRAVVVDALRAFREEVFAPVADELEHALVAEAEHQNALAPSLAAEELINRAAGGYRYVREPGIDRVVLVPHVAASPWLLLCQHRDARVICYPLTAETADPSERILALGRALGDEKRVAMLLRLRRGDATLQELADETGVARSTAHHHLAQLRRARLVALRGNAGGYVYTLEPSGFREIEQLLAGFAS
jgi:DNA-binding transcriptional ArsR family regulator